MIHFNTDLEVLLSDDDGKMTFSGMLSWANWHRNASKPGSKYLCDHNKSCENALAFYFQPWAHGARKYSEHLTVLLIHVGWAFQRDLPLTHSSDNHVLNGSFLFRFVVACLSFYYVCSHMWARMSRVVLTTCGSVLPVSHWVILVPQGN